MAPASNTLIRSPSGPSGSTIAGILLFGLIFRNAGSNCWPLVISTTCTSYGRPISSSATLILRPFGVLYVWSSIAIGFLLRQLLFQNFVDHRRIAFPGHRLHRLADEEPE